MIDQFNTRIHSKIHMIIQGSFKPCFTEAQVILKSACKLLVYRQNGFSNYATSITQHESDGADGNLTEFQVHYV
jgi:hypothetical protein